MYVQRKTTELVKRYASLLELLILVFLYSLFSTLIVILLFNPHIALRFCTTSARLLSVSTTTDTTFEESYADLGARETYLATDHEDAIERVREAFTDAGFGLPTEFSPSKNIREHTGEEMPPTRVIGIGNPHAGKTVAELTRGDAAPLFPCSVVVQAVDDDRQRILHVSLPRVLEELGFAPEEQSEAWNEAVETAGSGVAEAFETLNASSVAIEEVPVSADD